MNFKLFAVLFLIISLVPAPAAAQVRPQTAASSRLSDLPPGERAALEKKALALLDEIVSEGMGLQLAENRIQVLISGAEILGKHDEGRARGYLQEAINQYLSMAPLPNDKSHDYSLYVKLRQSLREKLILATAPFDPGMALEFMRTTRTSMRVAQAADNVAPSPAIPEEEKQLEMQLAMKLAESDPKLALQFAEEALKQDQYYQLADIWRRLQRKDPKSAAILASEIAAKLKSADLRRNHGAASVVNEMVFELRKIVHGEKAPKPQTSQRTQEETSAVPIQETEQALGAFLETIISNALKVTAASLMDVSDQGQAQNLLSQAQLLLPEIEKYLPARVSVLRARLNQFDNAYYHPPAVVDSSEELEAKSATELVAMAEKSKGGTQDVLYSQAMMKALTENRIDLAKQISSQHLKGSYDFVNSEIERLERERALKEGKLEEARKALDKISSSTDRASLLTKMAENVKDSKAQKQLLDEARSLLGDRMGTRSQVEAQISLAAAYLPFDAEYSFTLLETAIEKLNSIVSASQVLMKFSQEMQNEDEELPFDQSGIPSWFTGGFDSKVLMFAQKDFARTKAAIAKWQPFHARLIISIILITSILGHPSNSG